MTSRTLSLGLFAAALVAGPVILSVAQPSSQEPPSASARRPNQRAPIPGLSRQPSEAASKVLLDPNDAVVLLLDHCSPRSRSSRRRRSS
jgi:hypothetical protein